MFSGIRSQNTLSVNPATAIRKYQVFISSTFRDLQEARRQVSWEVLKIGHIPVGMENLSALDERGWETIKSLIEQSDYFVLIIAGLYGSKLPHGKSWTRREYEYAREQGIPILAFVRESKIPRKMVERGPNKFLLKDFMNVVRKNHLIETWKSADDLRANVSAALTKQIESDERNSRLRAGWYRGPMTPSADEIATLSDENRRLRGRIAALDSGVFPTFVPEIIDAINQAPIDSEILIACDYAAYGIFSAGAMFDQYFTALRDAQKRRKCKIHAIIYGDDAQKRQVGQRDEDYFSKLATTVEYKKLLDALANHMAALQLPKPLEWTRAEFVKAMAQVQAHYIKLMKSFIKFRTLSTPFPLYLWITQLSAVWSISPIEPNLRFLTLHGDLATTDRLDKKNFWDEHGYSTHDKGLVDRLIYVWKYYKQLSSRASSTTR